MMQAEERMQRKADVEAPRLERRAMVAEERRQRRQLARDNRRLSTDERLINFIVRLLDCWQRREARRLSRERLERVRMEGCEASAARKRALQQQAAKKSKWKWMSRKDITTA